MNVAGKATRQSCSDKWECKTVATCGTTQTSDDATEDERLEVVVGCDVVVVGRWRCISKLA